MRKPLFNPGDRVCFASVPRHEAVPPCYPAPGTVGVVKISDIPTTGNFWLLVQWPQGSTSEDDKWVCSEADVLPAALPSGPGGNRP